MNSKQGAPDFKSVSLTARPRCLLKEEQIKVAALDLTTCTNVFIESQKIGELNEANMALKERIDLIQMEKVRCVDVLM